MKFNFFKKNPDLRWNKILQNYWKTLTAMFLIPFLLVNVLVFVYYRHILVNQTETSQLNILYQKQNLFERLSYEAEIIYSQVTKNEQANTFFELTDISKAPENFFGDMEDFIIPVVAMSSSIDSVCMYNQTANFAYTTRNSGPINSIHDKQWYDIYKEKEQSFVCARISDDKFIITYCFELHGNTDTPGLVVVNFNAIELLLSDFDANAQTVKMADNQGNVFYRNDGNVCCEKDDTSIIFNHTQNSKSTTTLNTITTYLKSTNSSFAFYLENESIFSGNEYFTLISIMGATIILAVVLSFIIAYILASKLYNYIADTILSLDAGVNTEEKDELRNVIKKIATNSLNSSHAEDELTEKIAMLRQSQTIALQTQITPHFLYNTLQAINFTTLKLCKGDNDASKMIVLFSELLHAALDTKSYLVPLSTEIDYVKQYLKIQQYKYGDKFTFVLDLQEGTENLTVIKLMLQPIVENAIHHGILPTRRKCRIILSSIKTNENKLIIKISNDGVPLPPDKLFEINNNLKNSKEITQSNHIGLSNVNQRVKLIFGDDYGCRIHSTEALTTVTITLPFDTK